MTYDSLRLRPLTLPTASSAGLCPVSRPAPVPKAEVSKGSFVPNGVGEGPVYMSSQVEGWYADEAVRLIVDPAYSDIVLIRGKELDGPQGMPLDHAFDIQIPAGRSPNGRVWEGRILVSGPGCFGLQVDGVTFEVPGSARSRSPTRALARAGHSPADGRHQVV